jgi:UDP-N-acetylmuramoylalanine--D-glutamate ligase
MRIAELDGKRVAIWGYGREGRAALTALRVRLPQLPLTVFCSEAEALEISADHSDVRDSDASRTGERAGINLVSTAPDAAALSAFDVVIKSPGISIYRPEVLLAEHAGAHFTSGTALWFAEHPEARVIAVTGTKGKSTVSALIAHLLRGLGRRVALAGNIGLPLLELLDPPQPPDWWVVELSSFQTREAAHVEVAVLNNLYEEHLDWHGTRERYAVDKLALAKVAARVVVNSVQSDLGRRVGAHPGRYAFGGAEEWHVDGAAIMRGSGERIFDLAQSPLRGAHNAMNLCAALAAIESAGEDALAAAASIGTFQPLPHRLQMLGERDGLGWVDDSIATTPQATLEALASLADRAVTVLVGGYERGLDWQPFAEQMRDNPVHAIITMGANGARIAATLRAAGGTYRLHSVATLTEAVAAARADAPSHGVILLSPGAPSFDQFKDYAERGCFFATMAGFDAASIGDIAGLGIA